MCHLCGVRKNASIAIVILNFCGLEMSARFYGTLPRTTHPLTRSSHRRPSSPSLYRHRSLSTTSSSTCTSASCLVTSHPAGVLSSASTSPSSTHLPQQMAAATTAFLISFSLTSPAWAGEAGPLSFLGGDLVIAFFFYAVVALLSIVTIGVSDH